MSDSQAVLDPDRLPWLTDDRQPRGKRAWTSVLLLAIVATLLLAGVSYWLGMESVRRVGDLAAARPQRPPPEPLQQQPQPSPPPLAMPQVEPVAEPTVTPPLVTNLVPPRPRLPLDQAPQSQPQPAGAKPPAAAPAASTAAPPSSTPPKPAAAPLRLSIQSRASFNCRLARARWEIAVCNNGDLATLDRDLAALTTDVWGRADAAKRARLARTRDRFIARRNACQSDACTNSAYVARLRELSDIMTGTIVPAAAGGAAQARPAEPEPAKAAEQTPAVTPAPKPAELKAAAAKPAPVAKPKAIAQSRASFDCRLARTRGEITVCNNGNLGLLDRQLALLYSQAWGRADAAKRARLLRTRDHFVTRRDACLSEMCTRIAYENRMRQVSDIMFGVDRQP
ncbi:MAG: hypothetical protein ABI626_10355 [Sphingomicrobium sp.]